MDKIVFTPGEHLVAETIKTEFLTIEAGALLKAPEGKYLALTVNGCGRGLLPRGRMPHRGRAGN